MLKQIGIICTSVVLLFCRAFCQCQTKGDGMEDWQLHINQASDVSRLRGTLINSIWGIRTLPSGFSRVKPEDVEEANDIGPLPKTLKVFEKLNIPLGKDISGFAYYIVPSESLDGKVKQSLVVVVAGHQNKFTDNVLAADIVKLVKNGFSVLAVYMPGMSPTDQRGHDRLYEPGANNMHYFFDTTLYSLNYIANYTQSHAKRLGFSHYKNYSMFGISGGGWTTTVYAALDTRISLSFPVAGSIPLSLRKSPQSPNWGDWEQRFNRFYKIVGYPDLYLLGSVGMGRKEVQVLNANDSCCFAVAPYDRISQNAITNHTNDPSRCMIYSAGVSVNYLRDYESRIQRKLSALGIGGTFELEIDQSADGHTISDQTFETLIYPDLLLSSQAQGQIPAP